VVGGVVLGGVGGGFPTGAAAETRVDSSAAVLEEATFEDLAGLDEPTVPTGSDTLEELAPPAASTPGAVSGCPAMPATTSNAATPPAM
jgi:hypothetical protein